jgi:hypothetical protein
MTFLNDQAGDPMQTTKRVAVTLTFATDAEPGQVLGGVVQKLGDANEILEATHVHGFDMAGDGDDNGDTVVQLVVGREGNVTGFVDNPNSAHALAEELNGVVVEVPVDVDCRTVTA